MSESESVDIDMSDEENDNDQTPLIKSSKSENYCNLFDMLNNLND